MARKAQESFDEAWNIINSDGWKVEKQTPEGDVVHSKYIRRNHKIFRITVSELACPELRNLITEPSHLSLFNQGTVEIPPKLLFEELDQNIEHVPSWNPTLLECRTLKVNIRPEVCFNQSLFNFPRPLLQVVNDKISVSYQLAAEGGGGIISARDFVNLRYCDVRDGIYVCAGAIKHLVLLACSTH